MIESVDLVTQAKLNETFFERIPLAKIVIAAYNRLHSPNIVQKLVANWQPDAVGTIITSLRDNGEFALLDGQHRYRAAQILGITELPSLVYIDLTYEREAELFVLFNTVNKHSARDKLKARIEAQEPTALAIRHLVLRNGLEFDWSSGGTVGKIAAVGALEYVYTTFGSFVCDKELYILHAAWPEQTQTFIDQILRGMGAFLVRYIDTPLYSQERLISVLSNIEPKELLNKGRTIAGLNLGPNITGPNAYGIAILGFYNHKLTSKRLPEWQMRIDNRTSEARSAAAKKGNETLGAEQRRERSLKAAANISPELRRERAIKAAATRRKKNMGLS